LVMGSVIGSGIFMTAGFIIEFVPSPGMVMAVWLVGGIITLCGALSFGELAAMFPKAGGQFIYLKEAYGAWSGFLFGWTFFWVIECGGIAALAVGFAEYFGYFFPALSTKSTLLELRIAGLPYSLSAGQLVAVAAIIFLSGINYFGVRSGILVQNFFTFVRLASLASLFLIGWLFGKKSGIHGIGPLFSSAGAFNLKALGLALFAVLWTYDGWYSVNCTAEEIKKPERAIPISLTIGTIGVTLIYLAANWIYLLALPVEAMKGIARVGEIAATSLFGPRAAAYIAGAITLAIFGCLSATILYGPRVYYAMSEQGLFFRRMRSLHPRYRVPTRAISGQALWASVLCLSGTYQALYEYVIFAVVLFLPRRGRRLLCCGSKNPL
jgi:APA family basic amino acid/polyamine antiporter